MTALSCSFFNNAMDNRPAPFSGTWCQLRQRLDQFRYPRPGLTGDEAKKSLPAISGTIFRPGARRSRENAVAINLLILDFDNAIELATGEFWPDLRTGKASNHPKLCKAMVQPPVTFQEVLEALWAAEVDSYTWTTWSHTPKWPRFRVVIPLTQSVPVQYWEAAAEWALKRLGIDQFRRGLDLPVLRDIARLNFLAAASCPVMVGRGETIGEPLSIPLEGLGAITVPLAPHAPSVEPHLAQNRQDGYAWAKAYPGDLKALRLDELLSSIGVKVGPGRPYKGGTKWRTHCPWSEEHTHGLDDDSGCVIQDAGRWPIWCCSHSCHAQLGLVDVLRASGVI